MSKPNGILAMNPERYREIDGVVFDLDSYARHCKPASEDPPSQTARVRGRPLSRRLVPGRGRPSAGAGHGRRAAAVRE